MSMYYQCLYVLRGRCEFGLPSLPQGRMVTLARVLSSHVPLSSFSDVALLIETLVVSNTAWPMK